jgi:hypothetical protein
MKDSDFPPRLSESSSDARVVTALEVARSYDPPKARMQSALARLEATRGTSSNPGPGAAGRSIISLKAGVLAAIVCAIGAGWSVHRSGAEPPAPPVATIVEPAATAGDRSTAPEAPASPDARTMRVDDLPTATPTPAKTAPERSPDKLPSRAVTSNENPAARNNESAFDDELALVESARTSLAKGDAAACLAQLDQYEQKVRGGVFEREVAVMRIEALVARGETGRARALAEAFLARSPESPYTNRIRSLLARLPAPPTKAP